MKLLPSQLVGEAHAHGGHEHSTADGIEWEDDMVDINKLTTPANFRWKLIDRDADAENHEINWQFKVGDRVNIRLLNEMAGHHPMHHPFHIHGAGRFLVLARDMSSSKLSGRHSLRTQPARPCTSCSTSPTRAGGWLIAISPSITRAE